MRPLRVLSIEGGGIRGYYSASLLDNLSYLLTGNSGYDIGKKFDLICGTSTGAILACGLANRITTNRIKQIYEKHSKSIFQSPQPNGAIKGFLWAIKHTPNASSDPKALNDALKEVFDSKTLEEVYAERKIALCIPVVDFASHDAEVLKTPHLVHLNRDNKLTLVDACMASTAAPIFFPVYQLKHSSPLLNDRYFVDGGLWANNPILVALTEALQLCKPDQSIEIYRLGTITIKDADPEQIKKLNKGLWGWRFGTDALKLSIAAQSDSHNDFATLLAESFSKLGKTISIYNFCETFPAHKQLKVLGLDQVSSDSFSAMDTLSMKHAEYTKAQQHINPSCGKICTLFK